MTILSVVDRDGIERRDFPVGRRGYDPAAVDEHLRRVADEFEALRGRARRRPPLARGRHVRAGPADPRGRRAQRRRAARRRRATRPATTSRACRRRPTACCRSLDELERELGDLLEALRPSGERLNEGLAGCSGRRATSAAPSARRRADDRRRPRRPTTPRPPTSPPPRHGAPLRRRRGRRAPDRAQHGARRHAARGDRALPRRALRRSPTPKRCSTTSTRGRAGERRARRARRRCARGWRS